MTTIQPSATLLANPFEFTTTRIRTAVDELGNPWFCAKDVCAALDITWSGSRLQTIPPEWRLVSRDNMNQGGEGLVMLSEPALYRLIFRSNKPKAVEFSNWVCGEVLPALRKQGYYGQVSASARLNYSKQIVSLAWRLQANRDAFMHQVLMGELRDLCNAVGRPMPEIDGILGQPRPGLLEAPQ